MMNPPLLNHRLALSGFCTDENSSFLRGAAEAPPLIREALRCPSSNSWSERGVDLSGAETFFDAGDLTPGGGPEAVQLIENAVAELLAQGWRVISLGGDHAITWPIVRAYARHYPRLSILHFDAHPDLYDEFEGSRYSHACPFARIMEEGLAERLVQVGIRTINAHQRAQAARFGVELFEMKDWRDDLALEFAGPLYISFDLDGLDPAFAPGVAHREPGGLSTRQALNVIHRLQGRIVGADLVEYNPRVDVGGMTATVCARLLKEIAGRMLEESP